MKKLTITIEEAAVALGIGRNSTYIAARTGQIPTIRVGKRLLVIRAALERMLSASKDNRGQPKKSSRSRPKFRQPKRMGSTRAHATARDRSR